MNPHEIEACPVDGPCPEEGSDGGPEPGPEVDQEKVELEIQLHDVKMELENLKQIDRAIFRNLSDSLSAIQHNIQILVAERERK